MTKRLVFPEIAPKFRGRVPPGFVNDARGWTATKPQVEEAVSNGRLLTLDIDMAGHGACGLNCGYCYRRTEGFRNENRLSFAELERHMGDAGRLGIRSVKIIGPGEPLEDAGILRLLGLLSDLGVVPLVFTKGHVLGDDAASVRIHGMDADSLAERLKGLGATMLLSATSFEPELENGVVGRKGYHAARGRAIARLAAAGFNDFMPGEPTRLGLSFSPVAPWNAGEAFEAYLWARDRHIQPILAPAIIAGRARARTDLIVQRGEIIGLYARMSIDAIERGIISLGDLQGQGISAYGSAAPCSQLSVGMFLRGDGVVLRCPGNDTSIIGDVRKKSLAEIWAESARWRRFRNPVNNFCPPKLAGGSYPQGFFELVMERVEAHFGRR